MKTRELTGVQLDYWVAKAENADLGPEWNQGECVMIGGHSGRPPEIYSPSTDWAQGGPIIDACDMSIDRVHEGRCVAEFWTDYPDGTAKNFCAGGETRLIAAMRAKVLSVFGEEIDDAQNSA